MTFRVVRTNQYNQDLGLIHSTNGNHLESPNEGSSIDHQCWTWTGPTGPGPTDEHSVYLHHRDFIVTPIADQIGQIDSVSETEYYDLKNHFSEPQCKMTVLRLNSGKPRTCVTLNGSGIQLAVGPQPLRLRNHNSGLAHRIMIKRLATSPHDPLGITDSACKNQLVVVSVQYGPFNPYIPIRSTTIGKSRVAKDPIAMHTSWRSNSDIVSITRVSMTFRVVRTNQYNQDLRLIHSTNGNHLESPKEGSSIDHQVTVYLHAQNITMFPTNETWYFALQILVSNSGGLILILTAQSTRNSSEYTATIRCVS
ncbi:triacylglycerol lipase [Dorcoceras hygrometricum]|uniref:Triacylglycerol lipase n=1 Tax=Dorcoceras hygrometricum TaxID=472368 RepID=A0A2Z7AX45_9LAMI|nr:triacylglycerol lipase [Dorcoceras hygrometricum]